MLPLHDDVPSERLPFVNYLLILACLFAFVQEIRSPDLAVFLAQWAVVPKRLGTEFSEFAAGGGWDQALLTPLTAMFLHGGWLHLLGNMWFLFIFGDNVEGRLGHVRYLLFYLFAGVAATGLQLAFDLGSPLPQLGASGAIAGTLGAYLVMFPYARVLTLIPLGFFVTTAWIAAPWFLGIWFLLQAVSGLLSLSLASGGGGVAWWAHIGGFLVGVMVGSFFRAARRYPRHRRRFRR
ncbi:MAG: rhomboid family intramembrane serine protease [Cyanobacteria bacterium NC_groundwater_1444_Ag_S-0.65um_54_12]|nr:rhomboid family intramembrane serine protease [Cyanobacteria bacterium NC_groundwater_1444_Ag_S-0.65um_54_12]